MGMYTELNLRFALKKNTPYYVITMLDIMKFGNTPVGIHPIHKLFTTDRWDRLFTGASALHITSTSYFRKNMHGGYDVYISSSFKNYHDEILLFLNWIQEYIDTDDLITYLGWFKPEEYDHPTVVYIKQGEILCYDLTKGNLIQNG